MLCSCALVCVWLFYIVCGLICFALVSCCGGLVHLAFIRFVGCLFGLNGFDCCCVDFAVIMILLRVSLGVDCGFCVRLLGRRCGCFVFCIGFAVWVIGMILRC